MRKFSLASLVAMFIAGGCAIEEVTLNSQQVLDASQAAEWRKIDADSLLVMTLPAGQVVIELADEFAPAHTRNIRTLVANHYFDDSRVVRVQDNYVVQWGDPDADTSNARSLGEVSNTLSGEYFRPLAGLNFIALDSRDAYAKRVGFVENFPVGTDGKRAWLTHCYAMVGVGRDNAADSGNGSSLYVVSGHAPRHLDRNVTLVGRVVAGMEYLTSLPRGSGPLGFYETPSEQTPILRLQAAADLPEDKQPSVEMLRTNSKSFEHWVRARRSRTEDWFIEPGQAIGICNVPLPVRANP